jgi:hypothetical protein
MNWIQRILLIDEIYNKQLENTLILNEIQRCVSRVEAKLENLQKIEMNDSLEKYIENIKKANEMVLEIKGLIAQSRPSIKKSVKKRPRQQ